MASENISENIIVALDFSGLEQALTVVDMLGDKVSFYKVGMQLFYSAGKQIISELKDRDKKIFLDLKLHDIPNTVAEGVLELSTLGVDIINVHANGGSQMMKAAVTKLRSGYNHTKLIAVTELTSTSSEMFKDELGGRGSIEDKVVSLAELAKASLLDGVVASAQEANSIKKACGDEFLIVTPGVRLNIENIHDQKRVVTPREARSNGATHIVVGREVTRAKDPALVFDLILENYKEGE